MLRGAEHCPGPAERLNFPMADGTGDILQGLFNRPDRQTSPLAVLLHGLTGDEEAAYVQATAACLLTFGYPVLRLNLRGAGPSRLSCRRRYHAGRTDDLRMVLSQLEPCKVGNGIVMAGYSLGGNALLKLLGEGDLPVQVLAAASVSAPIDLEATTKQFMAPGNVLYHRWLLSRMKQEVLVANIDADPAWIAAARQARSVWAFDDTLVAPWNGWSGAPEYYRLNSALSFLPAIRVPTLVLHSLDDPWIPGDLYTDFKWQNPYLTPLLSPRGGHVGFHGRNGVWHDRCMVDFFAAVCH